MIRNTFIVQAGRCLVAMVAACAVAQASAQTYPTRPITLVVPYAAGGIVDFIGRTTAEALAERLGQTVIVENVAGASGTIGAARVAHSRPDGYTLLIGSGSEMNVAKMIGVPVSYDVSDFTPITFIGTTPMVLVGNAQAKPKTTVELLAAVKSSPTSYAYGTPGVGSPNQFAGELMNMLENIDIEHIPYKGAGPIFPDLMGGHLPLAIVTLGSAIPYITSGKIKAYGVTEAERYPLLPDVPALAEVPSLESMNMAIWWGLFAPSKTPSDVVQKLQQEFMAVLKTPKVAQKLTAQAATVRAGTSAELSDYMQADAERYRKVLATVSITASAP